MEKMASARPWPVALLVCAALVAALAAVGVVAPRAALRAFHCPVFQSVSCREERAESPNLENSRMPPV